MELLIYAVRNSKGQYFRAVGYGGRGDQWVDEIGRARLYVKIGQARARVTYFANHNPNGFPVPELIEFRAVESRVLDEAERVVKVTKRKQIERERYKERRAKWELEQAQRDLAKAQARIALLTPAAPGSR
jgi:hypothetical protein